MQIRYHAGHNERLSDTKLEAVMFKQFANSRKQKSMYIKILRCM